MSNFSCGSPKTAERMQSPQRSRCCRVNIRTMSFQHLLELCSVWCRASKQLQLPFQARALASAHAHLRLSGAVPCRRSVCTRWLAEIPHEDDGRCSVGGIPEWQQSVEDPGCQLADFVDDDQVVDFHDLGRCELVLVQCEHAMQGVDVQIRVASSLSGCQHARRACHSDVGAVLNGSVQSNFHCCAFFRCRPVRVRLCRVFFLQPCAPSIDFSIFRPFHMQCLLHSLAYGVDNDCLLGSHLNCISSHLCDAI